MKTIDAELSDEDKKFRDFALTGNMWYVILYIGTPLALYQGLNQLFKIVDAMMASHISAEAVSTVAYLSQINLMLTSIGAGLAVGASFKISQAYGEGNYDLVKTRVSSLFGMCGILGLGILLFFVPFTPQFLRFTNTPEAFISFGSRYFIIELFAMVIGFFNNVYIAIERVRGNSKRILALNIFAIVTKFILTVVFVYVLKSGIDMIAVATIISRMIMLAACIYNMRQNDNIFGFSIKKCTFKKAIVAPILKVSIPVVMEKIAFSLGKVIINSMSAVYGALTVGALGITNNIGGFATMPQIGFQEGGAAIISQNLGAKQPGRALDAFKKVFYINTIIGGVIVTLSFLFIKQITGLFAGSNAEFHEMIINIYRYEAIGTFLLGFNSSVISLLYGFGYTRMTLLINFCRLFLFRIPVLWAMQRFTRFGSESVGIVMMVSNTLVAVMSIVVAIIVIWKVCKTYKIKF